MVSRLTRTRVSFCPLFGFAPYGASCSRSASEIDLWMAFWLMESERPVRIHASASRLISPVSGSTSRLVA